MDNPNKRLNERVLQFVEEIRKKIEKASFEVLQEARQADLAAGSLQAILALELPDSQKEYNLIIELQKASKELLKREEECKILAMDDLDLYDFLESEKLSQEKLDQAAQKVFLYKKLGEDVEADLVEEEIRKICRGKGIKDATLNKIFKKEGGNKKETKEILSGLEVYGYDEQMRVWVGFRGDVETISHSSFKTQLPILLGPDIDVKEATAYIQRKAHNNGRICQKRTLGQGIHFINEKWVVISGKGAIAIDSNTLEKKEITSPLFEEDYLLDPNGKAWIDLNLIDPREAPENSFETVFREVHQIISDWEWRHFDTSYHVTAFAMLTLFQQAMKPWRPILYLSGAQGTGKTMFSGFLSQLFNGFLEILDKTTAHAIKQTFGNNAIPGFLDEFEHYDNERRQRDILNLLKTACRGGTASFGTTGKYARECHLNHLFWLASISFPRCMETDGAIKDRMIVFELRKKNQKFLRLPDQKYLNVLGIKIINAIIKIWKELEEATKEKLRRDHSSEQVDARQIENFVWASSLIEMGRKIEPINTEERSIVPKWSIRQKEDEGDRIIEEILHTKLKDGMNEYFVADLIDRAILGMQALHSVEPRTRDQLLDSSSEAQNLLRLNHLTVTRKEGGSLYLGIHNTKLSTFFEKKELFSGLDIKTILGRLEFIKTGKVKFGGSGLKAILIPLTEIDRILGRHYQKEDQKPERNFAFVSDEMETKEGR